jgi:hypothetical protein
VGGLFDEAGGDLEKPQREGIELSHPSTTAVEGTMDD